jgi:hypothetical protein
LLTANANVHILNNFKKRALDYADDPTIRAMLSRLETSSSQDMLAANQSVIYTNNL